MRGVTATEIGVGFAYLANSGTANAAIGAAGLDPGDVRTYAEIVIDEVNARGGVAGRQLVPIYRAVDAQSAEPYDQQDQAVCTEMTQDHEVFAVVLHSPRTNYRQCIEDAGLVQLGDGITRADTAELGVFAHAVEVSSIALDRVAALQVPAMVDGGYFEGWDATLGAPGSAPVRVGIVTIDHPTFNRVIDTVMVPRLEAVGHPPVDVIRIRSTSSTADNGSPVAAIQNAVLSMRSQGVTHVIFFEANATGTLLFANGAESQSYRPRYGINTANGLQALVESGNVPASQANGATGLGYLPTLDLTAADNPDDGPYSSEARRGCLALMADHGLHFTNPEASTTALAVCSVTWLFRDAVEATALASGGGIDHDGFIASVERLGSSFVSPLVAATHFAPGKRDGGGVAYVWRWNTGCGCLRYDGGPRPVS